MWDKIRRAEVHLSGRGNLRRLETASKHTYAVAHCRGGMLVISRKRWHSAPATVLSWILPRQDNLWPPLFPQHARDTPRYPSHVQEQHEAKQLKEMNKAPPLDHFYLHDDQQNGRNQKDEYVFAGHRKDLLQECRKPPAPALHGQCPPLLMGLKLVQIGCHRVLVLLSVTHRQEG